MDGYEGISWDGMHLLLLVEYFMMVMLKFCNEYHTEYCL